MVEDEHPTGCRVHEIGWRGDTIRTDRRTPPIDRMPDRIRDDSLASLKHRLDSIPVPLDRVEGLPDDVRKARLPKTYPPLLAVSAGIDGRVWVRRWAVQGEDRTYFDGFEADGRLRAVVALPREIAQSPTPWLSLSGIAAVAVNRASTRSIDSCRRPLDATDRRKAHGL
ncbi:MAG: hypothetical protein AB7I13_01205 [Vicinamibacterales bacterium]